MIVCLANLLSKVNLTLALLLQSEIILLLNVLSPILFLIMNNNHIKILHKIQTIVLIIIIVIIIVKSSYRQYRNR